MNKIEELRKAAHLSQAKLAEKLNVHQTAVSQWEKGRTYPDMPIIIKLAEIFNVSVDCLLGRTSSLEMPHMCHHSYGLQGIWAGSLSMYMTILRRKGNRKISAAELSSLTGISFNRIEEIIHSPSISTIDLTVDEIKRISEAFNITEDMFQDLFIPEDKLSEFNIGSPILNEAGMQKVDEYINLLKNTPEFRNEKISQQTISDDISEEILKDLKKHTTSNISAK